MSTIRKPRAPRKTTATAETGGGRKSTTARKRATPAPASVKRTAAVPAELRGTARTEVISRELAFDEAATKADAPSPILQGGAAPAAQTTAPKSLHRRIAEAAYFRAERRGFAPGGELMDWFEAEAALTGSRDDAPAENRRGESSRRPRQ